MRKSILPQIVLAAFVLLFLSRADAIGAIPGAAVITQQPSGAFTAPNVATSLSIQATSDGPITYRWEGGRWFTQGGGGMFWFSLADGPVYSGVSSPILTFLDPNAALVYSEYRCRVTNAAGVTISDSARLTVGIPAFFAVDAYLANYPDVAATIAHDPTSVWNHYINYGVFEGRTDGDFDVEAYLAQYPDLAAIYGSDLKRAAVHWYTVGRAQGLRVPVGFDMTGYFARNADIAALFANDKYGAWLHYYNYGLFESRSFDANFIPAEYLELNPDLKAAFGSNWQAAVMHWFNYGHPIEDRMGRVPIGFNVDNYLARYPDISMAFGGITPKALRNVTVWHHYIAYGTLEGRSDGDFEAYDYLARYPDLAATFGTDIQSAALHWFFYGRREGRRIPAAFDVQYYRARYPDLVAVYGDDLYGSWLHYLEWGLNEGRVFDELFRPDDYIALNPDLAPVIGNDREAAVMHWLLYGKVAGRKGRYYGHFALRPLMPACRRRTIAS